MNFEIPAKPLYKPLNWAHKFFDFFAKSLNKAKKKFDKKSLVFTKIQFVNINLILVEFKDVEKKTRHYCTVETYNKELYKKHGQSNWLDAEREEPLDEADKDHALQIANIAVCHTKWSKINIKN